MTAPRARSGCVSSQLALLLLLAEFAPLAGCVGSGAGGGATAGPSAAGPLAPAPSQLMFSTVQVSEPASISSDGKDLYLGSTFVLSAVDKLTWQREPLSGGVLDPALLPTVGLSVVEQASDVVRSGDWLYFDSWGYRIQRLYLGVDGAVPIEEILPTAGLRASCCQLDDFAADDQQIYWVLWDGNDSFPLYSRGVDGGMIRTLATLGAAPIQGAVQITPAASFVYVFTVADVPTVRRIDAASGAQDLVQSGFVVEATNTSPPIMPRAASRSQLFWMDGTTLRAIAHGSLDPQVIATGLTAITQLTTDGTAVYALQKGSAQDTILRIAVDSGASTPVITAPEIRTILSYEGRIWWTSAWTLEASEPDGTGATQIHGHSEIVFGGPLLGVRGRIVARWGSAVQPMDGILVFDIAAATTALVPGLTIQNVAVNSNALYVEDYNEGVKRVPVDAPPRLPETLAGDLSTIEAMFLDQGWLYWSENSDFWGVYRIGRMQVDGTGREVLFEGVHQQLALLGGRLYFLCEAACSLPGWTLVSMPLEGGTPTPEASVGLYPLQLIARNGLLYLIDTTDGASFGVWAIDVVGRRSAQLVSGLPPTWIAIDASSRWVYLWIGNCLGAGDGVLDRRRVEDWDRLGPPQLVDAAESCDNPVHAFHTDGTDLYYWLRNEGLKKCAE